MAAAVWFQSRVSHPQGLTSKSTKLVARATSYSAEESRCCAMQSPTTANSAADDTLVVSGCAASEPQYDSIKPNAQVPGRSKATRPVAASFVI